MHFVDWCYELEGNDSTQFIRLPLGVSSCLLNNQDVAVISSKTGCTVTRAINRLCGVEQPRIAVWHVTTASIFFKTVC